MRKRWLLPLLLITCAAGCRQPSDTPPPATPERSPEPSVPAEPPPPAELAISLVGAWRVAAIDGRPIDERMTLALVDDGEQLWWEPRCAGMARFYRIDGASISFRSAAAPVPPGSPPPPVCAIGLPPRLNELFRALDAARSIARAPDDGLLMTGGGHSVTLLPAD